MQIDVVVNGNYWTRYESDVAPRVGETLSSFRPETRKVKVTSVDHLLRMPAMAAEPVMREELITVTAEEVLG